MILVIRRAGAASGFMTPLLAACAVFAVILLVTLVFAATHARSLTPPPPDSPAPSPAER